MVEYTWAEVTGLTKIKPCIYISGARMQNMNHQAEVRYIKYTCIFLGAIGSVGIGTVWGNVMGIIEKRNCTEIGDCMEEAEKAEKA